MTEIRTLNFVNVGKKDITNVDKNAPVVSVRDKYSDYAVIPNASKRDILHLCFFPGDHINTSEENLLTKNQVLCLLAFVSQQLDKGVEKIYVQCGEGRIRSYTLVTELCYSDVSSIYGENVRFNHDKAGSTFPNGVIDRVTARNFIKFSEEVIELFKQVGDLSKIVLNQEENKLEIRDE